MKACEILLEKGIEQCEECHCAVGEDWEFKDFSNNTIVICPQCKTEIYLDESTEHFFDLRIIGSSTTHDEQELIDALYEFLKDKAEFQIK